MKINKGLITKCVIYDSFCYLLSGVLGLTSYLMQKNVLRHKATYVGIDDERRQVRNARVFDTSQCLPAHCTRDYHHKSTARTEFLRLEAESTYSLTNAPK